VDVDDVAVLQALVGRDAVAHHVVDRGADRLRVAAVAERRGDRAVVENEIVAKLVEFARADARLDVRRDEVERLGREPSGPAHALESVRPVQLDRTLVAPPIVGAIVDEIAGTAHGVYLACEMAAHKGAPAAWPAASPSLVS